MRFFMSEHRQARIKASSAKRKEREKRAKAVALGAPEPADASRFARGFTMGIRICSRMHGGLICVSLVSEYRQAKPSARAKAFAEAALNPGGKALQKAVTKAVDKAASQNACINAHWKRLYANARDSISAHDVACIDR